MDPSKAYEGEEKATHRAPAESLPRGDDAPPESGTGGPDDTKVPGQPDDGGEDLLSGLPRQATSQRVDAATEREKPLPEGE